MRNSFKKLSSLLLALTLLLSLSLTAFAADSVIEYKGREAGFGAAPGSEYTATDLFDNFKNVMPGDQLTESIQIKNSANDCDLIKVYMKAVVHDENGNPLTYSGSFENTDGKDQDKVAGQRDETVATMQDFLSQLTMNIYNGDQLIYSASPDEAGALADNVFLGSLAAGASMALRVELNVPIELGNEYANRVGEVDWVFTVESFSYTRLTVQKKWDDNRNKDGIRPDSVEVTLYDGDKAVETVVLNKDNKWKHTWTELDADGKWTVKETNIPKDYTPSYKVKGDVVTITNTSTLIQTGQLNWPIPVLGGLGILMIFIGILVMRKKRSEEN